MPKNKLSDLRDHLFMAIEDLNNPEKPVDETSLARAKAIGDLAQVIINSAKIEVDFLRIAGPEKASEFLDRKRDGEVKPLPHPRAGSV